MNIKLNIKSIIKFEQLTGKSFNLIDYTNEDDLLKLLYCIVISNNSNVFTLEAFKEILKSKKIANEITSKFDLEVQLIEQFSSKNVLPNEASDQPVEVVYVKDIASLLIINAGLDADFVMNDISINDLHFYMEAYNNKVKQEMESNRLWCYMSILPHIDSSKISSVYKFFPFPWEIAEQDKTTKTELKNLNDELPDIFKAGADLMNKINNQKTI